MVELLLRSKWGFCDAPISEVSNSYEYCFVPNQDRHRFGNYIKYNSFSQRSEEPKTKKRVLGCGDSVINGGVQTDQKNLATTLFEQFTGIQMLNISAGSWGPDNIAAYLKEKGTFDAEGIIVCLSSHDAHDNMDFQPVVGQSVSFPDKQYSLAIWELIDRYAWPRVKQLFNRSLKINMNDPDAVANAGIKKGDGQFNPGWEQLRLIAQQKGMWMAVYLHPERNEVEAGEYNEQGQEIIAWAKAHDIPLYLGLQNGESLDGLRDNIHLNDLGQQRLAKTFVKIYNNFQKQQ